MASACTDQQLAILNVVLYSHPDMDVYGTAKGFEKFSVDRDDESGFIGIFFTKDPGEGAEDGAAVFAILGTDSSKGKDFMKGQMRQNYLVGQDSEEDMDITQTAEKWVRDGIKKIEAEKQGSWKYYVTGHSLGGSTASCIFVSCSDKLERCVTFESPGMIKYWRNKAESRREASYWREHITEYVTFPNAISTVLPHIGQVVRIELTMQSKVSAPHIMRCTVGSSLRFMVWVSVANVIAAATGHAQGFWAAKVGSVVVKLTKLLFARKFTPKNIKIEFKAGLSQDQASKDSRAAENKGDGDVDDPAAKPLVPLLRLLPAHRRPAVIVGFWAAACAVAANMGYFTMRTLSQINDTQAWHSIDEHAKNFDDQTGKPKKAVIMKTWPCHAEMIKHGLPGEHFRRSMLEGLTPFHPTAYGLHNLFRREQLLFQRAATMPDFEEERPLNEGDAHQI